jgi:septum site-determining protein MinD
VPADDRTITAANRGVPVVHDNKASSGAAFLRIAARIDGDEVPLLDLDSKSSLFDRLKGIIGLNGRAYSHA